jgi:hypothetical protein
LHYLVSRELWLHSNAKSKGNGNMHFFNTLRLISKIGHGARHATNAVIAATRQSAALDMMPKQRCCLSSKWRELV